MRHRRIDWLRCVLVLPVMLWLTAATPALGQAEPGKIDEAKEAASSAAREVAEQIEDFDVSDLTPDEIITWLLVGLLVGSLASLVFGGRHGRLGLLGSMVLGCIGAAIGGIIVEVLKIDLDLGKLSIHYEKLIAATVLSVLVLGGWRVTIGRFSKRAHSVEG